MLNAGPGYGGGCLPKDLRSFMARAGELGVEEVITFLREVDEINRRRRARIIDVAHELVGADWVGRKVDRPRRRVQGRHRRRPVLARTRHGRPDPAARRERRRCTTRRRWRTRAGSVRRCSYAASAIEACEGAHVVLHLTEWPEFRELDPAELKTVVVEPGDRGRPAGAGRGRVARRGLDLPGARQALTGSGQALPRLVSRRFDRRLGAGRGANDAARIAGRLTATRPVSSATPAIPSSTSFTPWRSISSPSSGFITTSARFWHSTRPTAPGTGSPWLTEFISSGSTWPVNGPTRSRLSTRLATIASAAVVGERQPGQPDARPAPSRAQANRPGRGNAPLARMRSATTPTPTLRAATSRPGGTPRPSRGRARTAAAAARPRHQHPGHHRHR